jgi:CRP-like cAMP-binding protein
METQELSELFSLFHNLSHETLEWLLPMTENEYYDSEQVIISEDNWGKSIYFIISGWLKVQNFYQDEVITVEIIGKGGFVGEAGILGNLNFKSNVVAISEVEVLTISAQRFIQILFRDSQIQNRLLRATINRVIEYQKYHQFYRQTGKVRLATILISLADKYGTSSEHGLKIYNFLFKDLADLAQLTVTECSKIMTKFEEKGLIIIDLKSNCLYLANIKQIHHIIGQLGNE